MLTSEFPADDLPADDLPADDPPVENFAPYIWGDVWTTSSGTTVEISGWVMDEYPEGLTVTFSGAVSGTTTTDEFGGFSLITDISELGPIYATVVDAGGLVGSDEMFFFDAVPIDPPPIDPPADNLAPYIWGDAWTTSVGTTVEISGWVMDEHPEGLIVTFSGVVSGTTTTDGFGGFSLITDISALGPIYATVVDAGGLVGSDEVFFFDAAPDINDFSVLQLGPNEWVLRGTVVDEAPVGLIVTFGGVVPGGLTAVVEADGTFERYFTWNNPSLGMATATVDDVWSQTSNLAEGFVFV
jgi:hypothetical protein